MKKSRKALEKELEMLSEHQEYNYARVIAHAKKHFEEWSLYNLKEAGYPDIKVGYMSFLMNIGVEGVTNNDLAKRIRVTKQAMSKTVKELQQLDLIEYKTNPSDARSTLITLTLHGLKMVIHSRHKINQLTEKYVKVIGVKKYNETIDALHKIIAMHLAGEV
jgi:DNA-binding MarR family transcriptional regulator